MKCSRDLTIMADALLAEAPRDRQAPHYVESTFKKKLELASRREKALPIPDVCLGNAFLFRDEWREILKLAKLTQRQRDVFVLRTSGWTFEAIGQLGGHTKQGAQSIFFQALKKIRRAHDVYPYAGLAEVYRSEVSRH